MPHHRPLRKPLTIAILGLAATAAAFTAAQADRRGGPDKMFVRHGGPMAEADANGDKAIDAAEWSALFTKIDADGNGKLEGEEMHRHHRAAHPEALAFMILRHADGDRDGEVTSAEWKAHVAELDADKDGELSPTELRFRHRLHEDEASLPPFAAEWDTDGDGRLATAELDALFASVDDDKDGVLTFPQMRHRRR